MSGASLADLDISKLTPAERDYIIGCWHFWRRKKQTPPKEIWDLWFLKCGRGFGKTRTGAEMTREKAQERNKIIHVVGRTARSCRDELICGESGLLACCQYDRNKPIYKKSECGVYFPLSNSLVKTFSGEEPDQLRGPQCHYYWADELSHWKYAEETYDNLCFGARLGNHVQGWVTSTPKPNKVTKSIIADSKDPSKKIFVVCGSTYENEFNLSPNFIDKMKKKYEGTRLGRQELHGEILDDNPNAIVKRKDIDNNRVTKSPEYMEVVNIGCDPSVTSSETSDESAEFGIIPVGRAKVNGDYHYYVLDDMSMNDATPAQWGAEVATCFNKHKANNIIAESNNGGEMILYVIRTIMKTSLVPVTLVHASRGKATRAEPIAALYEQGRVHHVGSFPYLEDQLCEWEPGDDSPDRLDALVWGITSLLDHNERIWRL